MSVLRFWRYSNTIFQFYQYIPFSKLSNSDVILECTIGGIKQMMVSLLQVKFFSRVTGEEIEGENFFAECPGIKLSEHEISDKIEQLEHIIHVIWNERFRLAAGQGFSNFTLNILNYDSDSQKGSVELMEPDIEVFFVLHLPVIAFIDLQAS